MSASSLPAHLADYQERVWDVVELALVDEQPQIEGDPALVWCDSDSEQAARVADLPSRLYIDLELLAADQDPRGGGQVGRLGADWDGHPAGSLAILSYAKMREGRLVYLLEPAASQTAG